jgi:hypothetical protein
MFEAGADMSCLRQGDVLANIPFPLLPLRTEQLRVLGTVSSEGVTDVSFSVLKTEHRGDPDWLTCQVRVRLGFAVVVSQCCDLEPNRKGKISRSNTIALARLIDVPASALSDTERGLSLRANRYPLNPENPGYINLFHIPAHEKLGGREWVVDYSQLFCIPATEFPAVLTLKVLQMDADHRIRFKIKLAASLGRLEADELTLNHPWVPQSPALPGEEPPAPATV